MFFLSIICFNIAVPNYRTMARDSRKRHVVSYEKMNEELASLFNEKYPKGYNDYLQDLVKFSPGIHPVTGKLIEPFYAVTIETDSDIYLVKIKVDIDDAEDIERWLEGEEEAETEAVAGTSDSGEPDGGTLPDDNISQYGGDDDSSDA